MRTAASAQREAEDGTGGVGLLFCISAAAGWDTAEKGEEQSGALARQQGGCGLTLADWWLLC